MHVIREDLTNVDALTLPHMAHGTAICLKDRVNVRADPTTKAKIVGQLMHDQEVIVFALDRGWMIVQESSGLTGWAAAEFFKVNGALVA